MENVKLIRLAWFCYGVCATMTVLLIACEFIGFGDVVSYLAAAVAFFLLGEYFYSKATK